MQICNYENYDVLHPDAQPGGLGSASAQVPLSLLFRSLLLPTSSCRSKVSRSGSFCFSSLGFRVKSSRLSCMLSSLGLYISPPVLHLGLEAGFLLHLPELQVLKDSPLCLQELVAALDALQQLSLMVGVQVPGLPPLQILQRGLGLLPQRPRPHHRPSVPLPQRGLLVPQLPQQLVQLAASSCFLSASPP